MNSKLLRLDPKTLAANPRANLTSWTRYEPLVLAALANHPKTYIYRPSNMSPSTVCTRARDSVRGCLAFHYPTKVAHEDLARWFGEVVFKYDHEKVYIGPPEQVESTLSGESDTAAPLGFSFLELSLEEVIAFSILLSSQRISGPIYITHPPDLSLLPPRPNVELLPKEDGSLVLL